MGIKKTAAGLLLAAFTAMAAAPAAAQAPASERPRPTSSAANAVKYSTSLHLAYVLSPSNLVNQTSQAGLDVLAVAVKQRTSIEPAGAVGLDIERDELSFFPFIYWPVTTDAPQLSENARKKVQNYINTGGVIVFDILDQGTLDNSRALRRVLGDIQLKPLAPFDKDHTLTKTYYLLTSLPGSSDHGSVLVEQAPSKKTESISSVIIGENNWAGAWAGTFVAGASREQEMALRAGVNMVMYAVMGNYKSDQVHVPMILKKLGK